MINNCVWIRQKSPPFNLHGPGTAATAAPPWYRPFPGGTAKHFCADDFSPRAKWFQAMSILHQVLGASTSG